MADQEERVNHSILHCVYDQIDLKKNKNVKSSALKHPKARIALDDKFNGKALNLDNFCFRVMTWQSCIKFVSCFR